MTDTLTLKVLRQSPLIEAEPERETLSGRFRSVWLEGEKYFVAIERRERVRIPYKPRGPGAYGYRWHGTLRRAVDNRVAWTGDVAKNAGALTLLRYSGALAAVAVEAGCRAFEGRSHELRRTV